MGCDFAFWLNSVHAAQSCHLSDDGSVMLGPISLVLQRENESVLRNTRIQTALLRRKQERLG